MAQPHLEGLLLAAVSNLASARELSRVTEVVRTCARQLTNADGVSFVLKDGNLCFYVDEDAIAPLWKGRRFPQHTCVSGWAMQHRQTVVIPDITLDPRVPLDAYRPTFVRSLVMVPVRREDPIAAIGAYWATLHEATQEEQRVLEALAQAASLALMNVQLWSDLHAALEREQRARSDAERARAAAEEANHLKDQFLAVVSHELRTPLHVMRWWVWQLQREPAPDKISRAAEVLDRNVSLQSRLIEDLLDVSRAAASQLSIERRVVDLARAVRSVVDLARASAEANDVTLTSTLPDDPPVVIGDPDRIQQILWNVVGNAVKFTPEGGSVHVSIERVGAQAAIVVRDTGIGIDPAFLPYVFDEFRQADASTTRRYGGLGLGLTIVRELVQLHGGTVTVESSGEGHGTTVRVEFPICVQDAAQDAGLPRGADAEAQGAA